MFTNFRIIEWIALRFGNARKDFIAIRLPLKQRVRSELNPACEIVLELQQEETPSKFTTLTIHHALLQQQQIDANAIFLSIEQLSLSTIVHHIKTLLLNSPSPCFGNFVYLNCL